MGRLMDLIERNKQRDHEIRMERRRNSNKKLILGALTVIGVAVANRSRKNTIEIHETIES